MPQQKKGKGKDKRKNSSKVRHGSKGDEKVVQNQEQANEQEIKDESKDQVQQETQEDKQETQQVMQQETQEENKLETQQVAQQDNQIETHNEVNTVTEDNSKSNEEPIDRLPVDSNNSVENLFENDANYEEEEEEQTKDLVHAHGDDDNSLSGYMSPAVSNYAIDGNLPPLNEKMDNCIVIAGLPIAPADKLEKLERLVVKLFSSFGPVSHISIPLNEENKTSGFGFIEYLDRNSARDALERGNNIAFDKNHKLTVKEFTFLNEIQNIPNIFVPPPIHPFTKRTHPQLWLKDSNFREQFAILSNKILSLFWNERNSQPTLINAFEKKCANHFQWSPNGTFLIAIVNKGVKYFSGANFDEYAKFPHSQCPSVTISPNENYLVTFPSNEEPVFKIWSSLTEQNLATLPSWSPSLVAEKNDLTQRIRSERNISFVPVFKFSPNDLYVARLIRDGISVYELPSMEEKILKADYASEIEWSPGCYSNGQKIIAYSSVEHGNIPARIGLLEFPSKNLLRFKALINVTSISLSWQSLGHYLACNVIHRHKVKSRRTNSIELFRVRENQVPVEMLNFGEQIIIGFAWEPNSDRFAVIHEEFGVSGSPEIKTAPESSPVSTDDSTNLNFVAPESIDKKRRITKISVSFFQMVRGAKGNAQDGNKKNKQSKQLKKNEVHFLFKLENRKCTSIHWSPEGNFVILARIPKSSPFDDMIDASIISGNNTHMEFVDVENMRSYASMDLKNVNTIQWDPSGRFVTSAMCLRPIQLVRNRYTVHTFLGQLVSLDEYEAEIDFKWRPRPVSLLSEAEKQKIIATDLKRLEEELQSQDVKEKLLKMKLKREEFERKRLEFKSLLEERLSEYKQKRPQIVALRHLLDDYDSEDENSYMIISKKDKTKRN